MTQIFTGIHATVSILIDVTHSFVSVCSFLLSSTSCELFLTYGLFIYQHGHRSSTGSDSDHRRYLENWQLVLCCCAVCVNCQTHTYCNTVSVFSILLFYSCVYSKRLLRWHVMLSLISRTLTHCASSCVCHHSLLNK